MPEASDQALEAASDVRFVLDYEYTSAAWRLRDRFSPSALAPGVVQQLSSLTASSS